MRLLHRSVGMRNADLKMVIYRGPLKWIYLQYMNDQQRQLNMYIYIYIYMKILIISPTAHFHEYSHPYGNVITKNKLDSGAGNWLPSTVATSRDRHSAHTVDSQLPCQTFIMLHVCVCVLGADHHLVHWLSEPDLLLILCLPGREGCRRQQRLCRVWKLCRRLVVGSGKSVCMNKKNIFGVG